MKLSPENKKKIAILIAVISIIIGFLTGMEIVGKEARLVQVITIYATGMSCGIALMKAVKS